jgi:hypothetical protein
MGKGLGQARQQPEWLTREVLSIRHAPSNATPHAKTASFAYSQASNTTMTSVPLVRAYVEPPAGIEPATPSLPFVLPRTCSRERRGQVAGSVRG